MQGSSKSHGGGMVYLYCGYNTSLYLAIKSIKRCVCHCLGSSRGAPKGELQLVESIGRRSATIIWQCF